MRPKFSGIQIEVDPEGEAIYLRLSRNRVKATRPLDTDVLVDVDAKGRPVGLEFLHSGCIVAGLRKFQQVFDIPALRRIRVSALQKLLVPQAPS